MNSKVNLVIVFCIFTASIFFPIHLLIMEPPRQNFIYGQESSGEKFINGNESEKVFTSQRGDLNISIPKNFDVIEKKNRFFEGPDLIIDGPHPSDNISLVIYYDFPFNDVYTGLIQYRNVILNDDNSSLYHRVIEDISMNKWKVGGEGTGSFIYSINDKGYGPMGGVEVLFATHNNRTYNIEFSTDALEFDSPNVQEMEHLLINSIQWTD